MGLSKYALAQLRVVVREEIRIETLRLLNPTFVELVTRGAFDMQRIFDAVMTFQSELDELRDSVSINTRAVERLQAG